MKRRIVTFITVLSMCYLTACNAESKDNAAAGNNNEVVVDSFANEPTAEPVVEATVEPIEEPVAEVTAAPEAMATEEPVETKEPTESKEPAGNPIVVYEGIDMESDLPGEEWVETFVGIIEEPKIVVFSDETGRKEIFENDSIIKFNPDTDMIGVYLPDGYIIVDEIVGISKIEIVYTRNHFEFFELKPKETRERGVKTAAFFVEYEGEKIEVPFVFVPE